MGKQVINLVIIGVILFAAGQWFADLVIHHTGGVRILGVLIAAIWLAFLHTIRGRELDQIEGFFIHIGHALAAVAALWTIDVYKNPVIAVGITFLLWLLFELKQHGKHKQPH